MNATTQREAAVRAIEALEEFLAWPEDDEHLDDEWLFQRVIATDGEAALEVARG